MVFSDTITNQGIVQEIDFLVNTDSTKFPISDKTRIINRWYEKAVGKILEADGRWQFDDSNYTDLPIATTDLTNNQQDYSFSTTHLRVTRMEVKDRSGTWTWLQPMDQNDVRRRSITEMGEQDGVPVYYDKLANSVFLYPKPNYTQAAGMKVYFQRTADLFIVTDTLKDPGFASIFHRYLALGTALEYAIANSLSTVKIQSFRDELLRMEIDIKEFYSKKSKDENVSLQARKVSYR